MRLKVGQRLRSAVSDVEVIVVRASSDELTLCCGGAPMVDHADDRTDAAIDADFTGPTMLGKRYVDDDDRVEILCTKGGDGQLALDRSPLQVKDAKPLPSSD